MKQKELLAAFCFILVLFMSIKPSTAPASTEESSIMDADLPSAKFTFIPVIPYPNETVTFDASRSRAGEGSIISYSWNFGDNTSGTGCVIEKSYTTDGSYIVTLTIFNSVGASATTSKMITILPKPFELEFDLYNQRGGQGRNQPSEKFAPGEIVELSALLTHLGSPVAYKPVSFEIRDACGETVLYRSDFTDLSGVARINFTLYAQCLPCLFGTWIVLATSSVSGQTVSDTVSFRVSGPFLDIFTQKPEPYNGRGSNEPSDAFAPQEEVIIYGEAHYNCEPIEYKLVAFEVRDPNGVAIDYRENETDENGFAMVSFRLASNATFGIYTVFGSVEILGEIATDTLTFRVGWIIENLELVTTDETGAPKNFFIRGENICFNLTAKNIALVPKIVTFTIVVHDGTHVPIGTVMLYDFTIEPGILQIFMISIGIPQWAYTGVAAAYANAYSDLPSAGGVPYCPEVSATFTITSA